MALKKRTKTNPRGPLGEDPGELRSRALKILRGLRKAYPDAHVPLNYTNPLELLIATILSAQCTDARVNEVTEGLFKKYRTASDWAEAPLSVLEEEVRSTGFFRSKARAIKESTQDLVERYGGEVPSTLEELTSLRGVGRKSANVLIAHAFDGQGIIVDTHFSRLSRRMGLTAEFDPVKIEFDLMRIVPERNWSDLSLMLTWHGRTICHARKPQCDTCPVRRHCPAAESAGEITWKIKAPARKMKRADGRAPTKAPARKMKRADGRASTKAPARKMKRADGRAPTRASARKKKQTGGRRSGDVRKKSG